MNSTQLSCTTLEARLADYLDGDLGSRDRHAVDAHLASCLRCAALVRDLERIRADAGALGELAPSRDLWTGIAARIEAPVVPLTPASVGSPPGARGARWASRVRLAAVAAGLVAVTAGVTYTLTASRLGDSIAAANRADSARFGGDTGVGRELAGEPGDSSPATAGRGGAVGSTLASGPGEQRAAAIAGATGPGTRERQPDGTRDASSTARVASSSAGTRAGAESGASSPASYAREIEQLREVFAEHKHRLDPRTAAILDVNLKVIDDAIAQSRAALAEDPASRFLNERLNNALEKKLDLLRTAARLPSRT